METDKLQVVVLTLVLLGLITGAGILILDKFGTSGAVTEQVTINDENLTWGGSINATETLAHGNLTSLTSLSNETDGVPALNAANYSINLVTGVITVLDNTSVCQANKPCYATYVYTKYDTAPGLALGQTRDALADIPETWLSLIVTVIVISIILVLIVKSFGGQR